MPAYCLDMTTGVFECCTTEWLRAYFSSDLTSQSSSTHGSFLSVSVFYLTTMPVKCMYGTYSQRSMPLIRLENWFMAILLSPLASCGKVFWGGNHLLWFITPRGLKLLVWTASVWNPWHLLLGLVALLGSAVQTLSLVWITSQAQTGWLMWKANKC